MFYLRRVLKMRFFSDNRQEIFNPHSRICVLLDNIKERCDCQKEGKIYFYIIYSRAVVAVIQYCQYFVLCMGGVAALTAIFVFM